MHLLHRDRHLDGPITAHLTFVTMMLLSSPQPASTAAAAAEMLPSAISPGARISLLISCLVIIAALQYPVLLSYFRNDVAVISGLSGERGKVLAALAGYSMYKQRTVNELHKKRSAYNKLQAHQKSVCNFHLHPRSQVLIKIQWCFGICENNSS